MTAAAEARTSAKGISRWSQRSWYFPPGHQEEAGLPARPVLGTASSPACSPLVPSHLPVMDEAQVLGGIHSDDGVCVQCFSSRRWLPAVEDPGHGEQPPSLPFLISLLLLDLQERGPIAQQS